MQEHDIKPELEEWRDIRYRQAVIRREQGLPAEPGDEVLLSRPRNCAFTDKSQGTTFNVRVQEDVAANCGLKTLACPEDWLKTDWLIK